MKDFYYYYYVWFLDRMGVGKKPRERPLAEFDGDEPEEIM
jgi:hypothetical protein